MAILQVRDLDDRIYARLKKRAQMENRSISQEVISIIEKYLANPENCRNTTREFLALAGSWDDERTAEEIVRDVRKSRRNSRRFGDGHVVFD